MIDHTFSYTSEIVQSEYRDYGDAVPDHIQEFNDRHPDFVHKANLFLRSLAQHGDELRALDKAGSFVLTRLREIQLAAHDAVRHHRLGHCKATGAFTVRLKGHLVRSGSHNSRHVARFWDILLAEYRAIVEFEVLFRDELIATAMPWERRQEIAMALPSLMEEMMRFHSALSEAFQNIIEQMELNLVRSVISYRIVEMLSKHMMESYVLEPNMTIVRSFTRRLGCLSKSNESLKPLHGQWRGLQDKYWKRYSKELKPFLGGLAPPTQGHCARGASAPLPGHAPRVVSPDPERPGLTQEDENGESGPRTTGRDEYWEPEAPLTATGFDLTSAGHGLEAGEAHWAHSRGPIRPGHFLFGMSPMPETRTAGMLPQVTVPVASFGEPSRISDAAIPLTRSFYSDYNLVDDRQARVPRGAF